MASPAPACKKALADLTLRYPNRSRVSDGIMGDAAHAKRKSDHNLGNAYDATHDPTNGVDCNVIAEQVKTDPRVTYVIWSGRIYKARTGKWETYTGPNKHNHHCHVSIKAEARNDLTSWPWSPNGDTQQLRRSDIEGDHSPTFVGPSSPRTLKIEVPMMTGEDVLKVQMRLGMRGYTITADGVYGFGTEKMVKRFQEDNSLEADGKVGPATRKALGL